MYFNSFHIRLVTDAILLASSDYFLRLQLYMYPHLLIKTFFRDDGIFPYSFICADPEEGQGVSLFLCNTDPDPLKITKLLSQNSMLGHHRHQHIIGILPPFIKLKKKCY